MRSVLARLSLSAGPCRERVYSYNIHVIDLLRIEGFEWDDGNSRKSVAKHGIGQSEAEQIFFNDPLLVVQDAAHSALEERLHALGRTAAGRLLHITFPLRDAGRLIRVISAP